MSIRKTGSKNRIFYFPLENFSSLPHATVVGANFFFCPFSSFPPWKTSAYLTSKLWDMAAAGVRKLREHFLPSSAVDGDEEDEESPGEQETRSPEEGMD